MSEHSHSQLNALREALDNVDQHLVELAAQRQRIVSEIGEIKAQAGRQLRDFRRERDVLNAVRSKAQELALDPDLAEDLIARLIEASLTQQEQDQVRRAHRGEGLHALVIGGAGRLGVWLANFLDAQGYQVTIADPAVSTTESTRHLSDWRQAGLNFDVIVLATPPGITATLLYELSERQTSALVFDVGSIKTPLIEALHAACHQGLKVCSVHPMFGPDTALLSGRHILLMDVGSPLAVEEAKAIFSDTMAETVTIPIDRHDRLMALVLGLSHTINIAFLVALVETGIGASELSELSSTTFARQLAIASDVAYESPAVYYEIQKLNEHGHLAHDALTRAVGMIQEAIAADDAAAFANLMTRGRVYVESLSGKADS